MGIQARVAHLTPTVLSPTPTPTVLSPVEELPLLPYSPTPTHTVLSPLEDLPLRRASSETRLRAYDDAAYTTKYY